MASVFTSIKPLKPHYSNFNNSYDHKTTANFGQIIPICYIEGIPGDIIKYTPQCIVRLQPTVAPILHKMEIRFESFFVPNRIIDENWIKFITGGDDGEYLTPPPKVDWGNANDGYNTELVDSSNNFKKGTLWDYFGLPCSILNGQTITPAILDTKNIFVSDLPFRAYNKVYNQYYRDENVENNEISLSSYVIQQRYWTKNDYFSSALPFVLRGVVPSLSASFPDSPVIFDDPLDIDITAANGMINTTNTNSSIKVPSANKDLVNFCDTSRTSLPSNVNTLAGKQFAQAFRSSSSVIQNEKVFPLKSDNSELGFTLNSNDIRWLMQAQKFLERQARGGVRYNEFIMNNFNVATGDYRVDRAEFIQSSKSPIIVSEIPQTSASTNDSPQGNLAGKGLGTAISSPCRYRVREYGIFITMCSIVPKLSYVPQGIGKEWRRDDKYNYFFPQFAHMSEQKIYPSELYIDANTDDSVAFGYTGIYNEYRHKRDIVTGDFRDILDYWHLARKFSTQPALNTDFLKISATDLNRVFAVQDEPTFLIDCYNFLNTYRPIPKFAEPGLVDHF